MPSDAAARLTATGEADEVAEARRAQGRLLSTLLAGIAQFERELIRERTGEDRKRAMAEGVKFGRKRKQSDYHRAEAVKRVLPHRKARPSEPFCAEFQLTPIAPL